MKTTLIFDFDGTLLDSTAGFLRAFQQFFQSKGHTLSEDGFLELGKGNIWANFHAYGFSEDDRSAFIRDYFPDVFSKSHLIDGIDDVLRILKKERGADLHLLTSNEHSLVEKKLNDCMLLDYFSTIMGREHGAKVDILRKNFPDPAGCWHIGDTVGDVIAGQEADMKTIAVTWGFHDEEMLRTSSPDVLIRTPSQLLEVV